MQRVPFFMSVFCIVQVCFTEDKIVEQASDLRDCTNKNLIIYKNIDLDCTMALDPSNTLEFLPGGMITISGGKTLVINSAVKAGMQQIFNYGIGNNFIEGNMNVEHVLPQWWGAIANDAIDDFDALQRAITYSVAFDNNEPHPSRKQKLYIPPGEYLVSHTLNINARYFDIEGSGFATLFNSSPDARGGTILKSTITDSQCDVIYITSNGNNHIDGGVIQSIKIEGSGNERHGIFVNDEQQQNTIWKNLYVEGVGGDGFHFEGHSFLMNFEFCQARACKGYGFNFMGMYDNQRNATHCLGQSALISCSSEECKKGQLKIENCQDTKVIGGQFQGISPAFQLPGYATVQISNAMGIEFYGPTIEGGEVGMRLDKHCSMVRIFGGRFMSQSYRGLSYEGWADAEGSDPEGHNTGLSIIGTCFGGGCTHIYLNENCYYATIDAWAEGNSTSSRSGLIIQDEGTGNRCAYGLSNIISDNLKISGTTGIAKMVVDAAGNVGIGTSAPQAKLHLNGDFLLNGTLRLQSAGIDKMIVDAAGNLGIGCSSAPQAKLDLNGDFMLNGGDRTIKTNTNYKLTLQGGDINHQINIDQVGNTLSLKDWGDIILNYDVSGTTAPDGKLRIQSGNGVDRVIVNGSGDVGIGTTTTPAAKLDVNGNVKASKYILGTVQILSGSVTPSTSNDGGAPIGSLYLKTNGTMYLKTSSTTWTLK